MIIDNLGEIQAVAFDVDGTLYRNETLPFHIMGYLIKNRKFFLQYKRTRHEMHLIENPEDFHETQLEILAREIKSTKEEAAKKLKAVIHTGLAPYFKKLKPCKGAVELIADLKSNNVKIALLSDLPPEQKDDIWGIKQYCDALLWSEDAGALKPSPLPFKKLEEMLGVPADKILYVGNNHTFDILGAKNAGFKTAWIINPVAAKFGKKSKDADITFGSYQQLREELKLTKKNQ